MEVQTAEYWLRILHSPGTGVYVEQAHVCESVGRSGDSGLGTPGTRDDSGWEQEGEGSEAVTGDGTVTMSLLRGIDCRWAVLGGCLCDVDVVLQTPLAVALGYSYPDYPDNVGSGQECVEGETTRLSRSASVLCCAASLGQQAKT